MTIILFLIFLFLSFLPLPALAQKDFSPTIIRDTEIEAMIKDWARPVIEAADLTPENINIILVQDSAVNAFVAGGPNIFIYTGLLLETENAAEIVGVIAHELGHIRGGHLVRMRGAYKNASYESMLGTLAGIGAAILTGNGGFGTAIAMGTQSMAQRKFLSFTRVQESSADQAALTYLEKAALNPAGLVSFMEKLEDQELLPAHQQDAYVRTHPLTRDRIETLVAGEKQSAHLETAYPPQWKDQHERMIAKLKAFIAPERIAWDYDDKDHSIPAHYARTIAAYRQNHVKEALSLMDGLLERERDNPFFWELKGQILVDFSRVTQALPSYKKALEFYPEAPLIQTAYAHALIETADRDKIKLTEAVKYLKQALRKEPRSPRIHRLLATAYGRMGQETRAKLHLAEESLLKGNIKYAKHQATFAAENLPKHSRDWLRAKDILAYIAQKEKTE